MTMKHVPPAIWFACRIGTAVVLCTLLVRSLDWPSLIRQATTLDLRWLSISILIPITGIVLSAFKWQVVLDLLGVRRPYGELLLRYWGGTFYNAVLPGSVGGDIVRIGGLARDGTPLATSTLSVLGDRIVGLWAGMLIGLVSSAWPSQAPLRGPLGLVFGSIAGGGAIGIWLAPKLGRYLHARLKRYLALAGLLSGRRFWYIVALGCAFQSLVVLQLYVAARALHTPIPLIVCGLYAPAVVLTTLLPISLNGVGVREATLVVLLAGVGVPRETAALMGVLIYVTTVVASLPGGLAGFALPGYAHNDSSPSML